MEFGSCSSIATGRIGPSLSITTPSQGRRPRLGSSTGGNTPESQNNTPDSLTSRSGWRRTGSLGNLSPRGRDRRATSVAENRESSLPELSGLPGAIAGQLNRGPVEDQAQVEMGLVSAPIMGKELMQVFEDSKAALSSPLATDKLEAMSESLQTKLDEMSRRQAHRCNQLSFAEPSLEASFRAITFAKQRSTYRRGALVLAGALCVLLPLDITAFAGDEGSDSHYPDELRLALGMRLGSIGLLVLYCFFTCVGSRNATLGVTVATTWAVAACYMVIIECHSRALEVPQENNMNILALMGVYIIFMPGMPFTLASCCGWGFLAIVVVMHFATSPWGMPSVADWEGEKLQALLKNMCKIVLFNLFGMLGAYEQIMQMRTNYWHAKLLHEALQLQKLVRARMHRLTSNTLPKAIVKAIGRGELDFVNTYPQCTVLQADMVGFTALSAQYPPQRVLGILSDIFEEFDRLSEENRVDKIKTIGDAYIVCAGALEEPRGDDAARVVRMGLAMQEVVHRVREDEGLDIAVRIGVHTGRVTGGIIGKVRFQFDMWGHGVNGAVRMEESGEKGRVQVSDATLRLVQTRFLCSPVSKEADAELADAEFNIRGSYLVERERTASDMTAECADPDAGGGVVPDALTLAHSGRASAVWDWPKVRDSARAPGTRVGQRMLRWVQQTQVSGSQADEQRKSAKKLSVEPRAESPRDLVEGSEPSAGGRDRADSNFFVAKPPRPSAANAPFLAGPGACRPTRPEGRAQQVSRGDARASAREREDTATARLSNASRHCSVRQTTSPSRRQTNAQPLTASTGSSAPSLGEDSSKDGGGGERADTRSPPLCPASDGGPPPPPEMEMDLLRQSLHGDPDVSAVAFTTSPREHAPPPPSTSPPAAARPPASQPPVNTYGGGRLPPGGKLMVRSRTEKLADITKRALDAALNTQGSGRALRPAGAASEHADDDGDPRARVGSTATLGSGARAETPAREEVTLSEFDVRTLMPEEVLGSLRRSAMVLSMLTLAFAFYDWLEWHGHPLVDIDGGALTRLMVFRLAGALPIAVAIALFLSVVQQRGVLLTPSLMSLVNMLLILLPFMCNVLGVWLAPDHNVEYMLCLALFHAFFGYTTMAVPYLLLSPIQLPVSLGFIFAEYASTNFNMNTRWGFALEQSRLLNASLAEIDFATATRTEIRDAALAEGLTQAEVSSTYYPTAAVYLVAAHLLGVLHNRKLRSNLFNHAKLQHEHVENMELISMEVQHCQGLLENIFPAEVLERLKQRNVAPGTDRHAGVLAEEFSDCTFLFAKIVGLKQLTEDEARPATDVIAVLQKIFDRFDLLADTFKVQKVRKTVNEYYMTASGLPDPTLIEGPRERALATAALAFSMVHIMDIINMELQEQDIGVTLQAQIGINTGSAIAGVIGHKRFQYDLCGDAVNTAARMCSYSKPGCITASRATYELLQHEYDALYRGEHKVKGKGEMGLYYLVGRTNAALREQRRLEDTSAAAVLGRKAVGKQPTLVALRISSSADAPPFVPPLVAPPPIRAPFEEDSAGLRRPLTMPDAELSTESMHPVSCRLEEATPSSTPRTTPRSPSRIPEEGERSASSSVGVEESSSAPRPPLPPLLVGLAEEHGALSPSAASPHGARGAAAQGRASGRASGRVSGADASRRASAADGGFGETSPGPRPLSALTGTRALSQLAEESHSLSANSASERMFAALRASPDPATRHLSRGRGSSSWALQRTSSVAGSETGGGTPRTRAWTTHSIEAAAEAAAMGGIVEGGALSRSNSIRTSSSGRPSSLRISMERASLQRSGSYTRNYEQQRSWLSQAEQASVSRQSSFASTSRLSGSLPPTPPDSFRESARPRGNSLIAQARKRLSCASSAKRKSEEMWAGKSPSQMSTTV